MTTRRNFIVMAAAAAATTAAGFVPASAAPRKEWRAIGVLNRNRDIVLIPDELYRLVKDTHGIDLERIGKHISGQCFEYADILTQNGEHLFKITTDRADLDGIHLWRNSGHSTNSIIAGIDRVHAGKPMVRDERNYCYSFAPPSRSVAPV